MLIMQSEMKDFERALSDWGYDIDDFEIIENENPTPAQGVGFLTGTVTVRNKKTGIERTYKAGNHTNWAFHCAEHLRAGVFGRSK